MPRLKFPTGQASAANLKRSPLQTTQRGAGYITAQIDPASMRALQAALNRFDPNVRKAIAKRALRAWGNDTKRAAKVFAYPKAERTKRQLTLKVKTYKKAVWAGVGVKTERIKTPPNLRLGRYSPLVGWKSHFMEVGWRAWPRGMKGNEQRRIEGARNIRIQSGEAATRQITVYRNGKPHTRKIRERARTLSQMTSSGGGGRGWRRGIRGRYGVFQSQYARHYLFKAARVGRAGLGKHLLRALGSAVAATQRGGNIA